MRGDYVLLALVGFAVTVAVVGAYVDHLRQRRQR